MLPKAPVEVKIESATGDYHIDGGVIHARSLYGPGLREQKHPLRTALFLHGGEMGSNHTLVERPARWLIARNLFDQIILPDRRGSGVSSPLARPPTLEEQAEDMRRLLNRMNIDGPLTVLGMDTAGPVALVLAGLDPRVGCVVLVASAPERLDMGSLTRILLRTGLLRRLLNWEIRRSIGKHEPREANFDLVYDAHTAREMSSQFREALKVIPAERADSLLYESETALDAQAISVPPDLSLDIPVLQVIGENDEVWGNAILPGWQRRFPNFTRKLVPGAVLHKDVFFQAEQYCQTLIELLQESCPLVK